MNRITQLTERLNRVLRLRNLAIEQNNILKKKQADYIMQHLTIHLNLTLETKWN